MENTTPLKAWMDRNGFTNRTLAERLNLSYELIYKLAKGQEATPGFKWQFAQAFGWEIANELFEPSKEPA